ncbi:MAG: diguanylate cyclase (GGDEF)-like protein [Alteromonadaceae bacterium]|jgi:diguanylate cyclase (GGDEF)-like protein
MKVNQKILIIDDEKSNLKILSETFKGEVEVILAKDGLQGINRARACQPDLILLDVVMPDMDGFQVITLLKNDNRTSKIPVIFVTGELEVQKEEYGLELGACDYIQKPFHVAVLKARVRLHLRMARQTALLEQLANIDPLTSIANRRLYEEVFNTEWRTAIRNETSFSLAIIDIDNFKEYNDYYGHASGDLVLEQVARTISASLMRPRDFVARFGGEEFVVLLPDTTIEGAMELMQVCRKAVADLQIPHEYATHFDYLSVSIGGNSYFPNKDSCQKNVFTIADKMLYKAKQSGKNCVVWQPVD